MDPLLALGAGGEDPELLMFAAYLGRPAAWYRRTSQAGRTSPTAFCTKPPKSLGAGSQGRCPCDSLARPLLGMPDLQNIIQVQLKAEEIALEDKISVHRRTEQVEATQKLPVPRCRTGQDCQLGFLLWACCLAMVNSAAACDRITWSCGVCQRVQVLQLR